MCCENTNLVIHHSITNVVSQTSQYLRILDIVEEASDSAPLCQRSQIPEYFFQFPEDQASGLNLDLGTNELPSERPSPLNLLGLALRDSSAQ